jgi:hypothetical protein
MNSSKNIDFFQMWKLKTVLLLFSGDSLRKSAASITSVIDHLPTAAVWQI